MTLAGKLEWFQGNQNPIEMKPLSHQSLCLSYVRMNNNTELNPSDLCLCVGADIAYEGCPCSNEGLLFHAHIFLKYYHCSR